MDMDNELNEYRNYLEEVEYDARMVIERVQEAKHDLKGIMSMADAEMFDMTHDLEAGLKHISIFT